MIRLTGSSTQISKIKEVVLMVDVENASVDSQRKGVPVIYDLNGEVVNSSKVAMSTSEVEVTIPVLKTKTVRIVVTPEGEPAPGFEVDTVSYQPDMVTVAGTPSDLLLLGTTLRARCDVSDCDGVVEENIDIASLWQESLDSLRLVDEDKLAVTITMKPYEEKVFDLPVSAVELRNLSEEYQAEIIGLSVTQIHILGKEAGMKELNLQKLAPYIDLSDICATGTYTLFICLENDDGLILKDVLTAVVEISDRSVPVGTDMEGEASAGTDE